MLNEYSGIAEPNTIIIIIIINIIIIIISTLIILLPSLKREYLSQAQAQVSHRS